ncbi:tetratricopeptide repeat protein [Verrucosispora sioxanthis]|uniref:hypothetical protein n=1 Tax=Verrucosispora sioxanthis TaxID=2499994 RepID=UPI001AA02FA0|nr:hypothetical protein [Verrucosispora sioxanthis]
MHISDVLYELGRYDESAQAAADGVSEARRVGISRSTGAYLLSNRAEALLALGRWAEADQVCAEAARLDPPGVSGLHWLQLRAALRLAQGHPRADETVARALSFLSKPYLHPHNRLPLYLLRLEAALVADDRAEALRAARASLTDPAIVDYPRYSWPVLAATARVARHVDAEAVAAEVAALAGGVAARFPAEKAYAAEVAATVGRVPRRPTPGRSPPGKRRSRPGGPPVSPGNWPGCCWVSPRRRRGRGSGRGGRGGERGGRARRRARCGPARRAGGHPRPPRRPAASAGAGPARSC